MPVFPCTLIPVFKISLLPKPGSSGKYLGQLLRMCNSYPKVWFLNWTFCRRVAGMSKVTRNGKSLLSKQEHMVQKT